MPVYLCRPGINKPDSWRHGMEVWLSPHGSHEDQDDDDNSMDARPVPNIAKGSVAGYIVRRIRHAEVVLADEVSEQYGRYWLRLRWPGPNGGFAGYVDAGPAVVSDQNNEAEFDRNVVHNSVEKNKEVDANEKLTPLLCRATSKYYPSTDFLKLLGMYDDGLNLEDNNVENNGTAVDAAEETSTPGLSGAAEAENTDVEDEDGGLGGGEIKQTLMPMTEPVFCRICREGLHDVEFDTLPDVGVPNATTDVKQASSEGNLYRKEGNPEKQAKTLIKKFQSHPLSENPLMSPCECSGSMAFVHRLCVEEWRCRSRHPAARNGLNCETCGGEYALPPPPIRPQDEVGADGVGGGGAFAEDDWVDAMPAHVLAALRRPHPWWRFCATVVRRKWLRPLAPIICSPIVATYCRCRRMLKKRGVSRRRWACSLCRRRARWKCVRCLRSYYCSRQCQNVSWHIMHKHMCYKPSRVWWSSVVYGVLIVTLFPGIWQNPFVYWTVLVNMMIGFFLSSNLAGSIATIMKKVFRVDLRGRWYELFLFSYSFSNICPHNTKIL